MFKGWLIHIDFQDVTHFNSLILLNTFLCNLFLVFWLATIAIMFPVRKPIRAICSSDKYDLRFQDQSFDVELLLEVESLLEVELLFELELLIEVELLLEVESNYYSILNCY